MHLSNLHKKVFTEPWHAQLFATTHAMAQAGHFEWKDWADHFSLALKTSKSLQLSEGNTLYYEIWLKAFEEFLIIQNFADKRELTKLKAAWTKSFLTTPHGTAVELVKS